jgi:hypothetical protein
MWFLEAYPFIFFRQNKQKHFIFADFVGFRACLLEIRQAFGLGPRPSAMATMVVL